MEKQKAVNTEVFFILNNLLCIFIQALGHFKTGGYSQAVTCYTEALLELSNVPPTLQYINYSILSLKGSALYKEGTYCQALKYMTRALNLNKTHELSLLRRAKVYLKIGEIQKGLPDLQSFVLLVPDVDISTILEKNQSQVDKLQETKKNIILKSEQMS